MSKVYKPEFEKFFMYEDISSTLAKWQTEKADFIKVSALGQSFRDRNIWMAELTDFNSGDPADKPGMYIEACIHAEEVMSTSVVMHIIWTLLDGSENDDWVKTLLKEYTFYIIPRVNPDGAEYCLAEGHPWVGNGRYLPGEDQPEPGLCFKDIDGNGVIAQMRLEDPNGEWKVSKIDPRLMELRAPYEKEGTFYRLFPEGVINDFDGVEFKYPKPRDGNLNRNFPANFLPDPMQYGAGEYPFSEPETACIKDVFSDHPNIAMVMSYHTNAGVLLRPFANKGDEAYEGQDLTLYKLLGQIGTEATGYPVCSVYEDFTPNKKNSVRGGTLTDWTYEQKGIPSYVTELWNFYLEAGIEVEGHYASDERSADKEKQLLTFMEEKHGDKAYLDWKEFQHPQLGKVEVGGWNRIWVFRNAPPSMIPGIAKKNTDSSLRMAATMPHLYIENAEVESLGGDMVKLSVTVGNSGYLSTNLTDLAKKIKMAPSVLVELPDSPDLFEVVSGNRIEDIGHLSGRVERRQPWCQWIPVWGADRKKVEWLLKVKKKGVDLNISASCFRAGRAALNVAL